MNDEIEVCVRCPTFIRCDGVRDVDTGGIDPPTSRMRSGRSTIWAKRPRFQLNCPKLHGPKRSTTWANTFHPFLSFKEIAIHYDVEHKSATNHRFGKIHNTTSSDEMGYVNFIRSVVSLLRTAFVLASILQFRWSWTQAQEEPASVCQVMWSSWPAVVNMKLSVQVTFHSQFVASNLRPDLLPEW